LRVPPGIIVHVAPWAGLHAVICDYGPPLGEQRIAAFCRRETAEDAAMRIIRDAYAPTPAEPQDMQRKTLQPHRPLPPAPPRRSQTEIDFG
jgi:hypothetical protein